MSLLLGLRAPLDELSSHVREVSQLIPKKAKKSYLASMAVWGKQPGIERHFATYLDVLLDVALVSG